MRNVNQVQAAVWKCKYCGIESIQIGDELGSSDTSCPKGCPGNFALVKKYPLATGFDGIKETFERELTEWYQEERFF